MISQTLIHHDSWSQSIHWLWYSICFFVIYYTWVLIVSCPQGLLCSVLQCVAVCCSVFLYENWVLIMSRAFGYVLQCVAVCCRVWQCVAVYTYYKWVLIMSCAISCVMQYVEVCGSVLYCVAVCICYKWVLIRSRATGLVVQCVVVCCSVLQCVAVCCSVLQWVVVDCSVLQRVAACCSVLQRVAACCSVLQCRYITSWSWLCLAPQNLCCSVLQCVAPFSTTRYVTYEWGVLCHIRRTHDAYEWGMSHVKCVPTGSIVCFKICCSMLQSCAACCSVYTCHLQVCLNRIYAAPW